MSTLGWKIPVLHALGLHGTLLCLSVGRIVPHQGDFQWPFGLKKAQAACLLFVGRPSAPGDNPFVALRLFGAATLRSQSLLA